jgi:hypothetical protein
MIHFSMENVFGKLTVYYKVHGEEERYGMPDVGEAHGITVGAEYQDSGHRH